MTNVLKVGDVVKSKDFVDNDTCYMVGLVVSVDDEQGLFRAKTVKRVWRNKVDLMEKLPEFFTAPLQGQMMLDDPSDLRIIVVA